MIFSERASGILLHPSSLPGAYGIGDLGDAAYRFVDWLGEARQSLWQILPLGPTSYGDSPYQTLSAFAGNPNLISLDRLVDDGWLLPEDVEHVPDFPQHQVDYGWVIPYHNDMLALAFAHFKENAAIKDKTRFEVWKQVNRHWLEDFTLFAALKDHFDSRPWVEWGQPFVERDPKVLKFAKRQFSYAIEEHAFKQWLFFTQWDDLKQYAKEHGVRFIGDIPIFVAHDSADVWANQDEYYLDADGYPTSIAGVPPDYFSPTGQRWGNPLYRWDVMRERNYDWWIKRFQSIFTLVDYARIDHFRGFDAYWRIPAEEETAIKGEWIAGPGHHFFETILQHLGELPIIAEDLGVITKTVEKLRDDFHLPGMKVLQFAWSNPENLFLPHQHPKNSIVYTGTHDNNTALGWWMGEADDGTRQFVLDYLDKEYINEIHWEFIRTALRSTANTCIVLLQDVLGYGEDTRMNIPSVPSGNWQWRFTEEVFDHPAKQRLAHYTWLYQRRTDQQERKYGDVAVPASLKKSGDHLSGIDSINENPSSISVQSTQDISTTKPPQK